ncbi:unnamed protein product [Gadus morhua 'NCC']
MEPPGHGHPGRPLANAHGRSLRLDQRFETETPGDLLTLGDIRAIIGRAHSARRIIELETLTKTEALPDNTPFDAYRNPLLGESKSKPRNPSTHNTKTKDTEEEEEEEAEEGHKHLHGHVSIAGNKDIGSGTAPFNAVINTRWAPHHSSHPSSRCGLSPFELVTGQSGARWHHLSTTRKADNPHNRTLATVQRKPHPAAP